MSAIRTSPIWLPWCRLGVYFRVRGTTLRSSSILHIWQMKLPCRTHPELASWLYLKAPDRGESRQICRSCLSYCTQ